MGKFYSILLIILLILIIPQIYYHIRARRHKSLDMTSKYFERYRVKDLENYKEIYLTNTDGFDQFVRILDHENPKGLVQLVHGMSEHSGNYLDFAKFLNDNGYLVIIGDHRGHGKSISEKYPNGYMREAEELVDDQIMISKYIKSIYPDKKLYLLGHSMGSMIARLYLRESDILIDKLVLTGTVPRASISGLGLFFARVGCFYFGEMMESDIIDTIVGAGKGLDFISYNQENIREKNSDPMRIFKFKISYTRVLIEFNKLLGQKNTYKVQNKDLKIYNMVGIDDPITKGEEGIRDSIGFLNDLGYKNIQNKVYDNMKHEILNETGKEKVYEDMLEVFDN